MNFRIAFGNIVRKLRERHGETQEEVGKLARYSDRAIGMLEQGLRAPSESLAEFYDEHYGMQGVLIELGANARKDSTGFPDWVRWEQSASDIRLYDMRLIPGLFQTEEYARAVIQKLTPWLEVEEEVVLRLSRQCVLQRAEVRAVIEQSVIERVIGDLEIHFEQLARLLTLPKNVAVQVMPTMAGLHTGLAGPLTILSFDASRTLVRAEARNPTEILDNPQEIQRAERAYNALVAAAMSEEQSAEFIAAITEELQ